MRQTKYESFNGMYGVSEQIRDLAGEGWVKRRREKSDDIREGKLPLKNSA
jgi:hypothetical protein